MPLGGNSDYLKGWVSKGERLKIAERSRRGKREKARRGETVGHLCAPLGFRYTDDRKALVVDPERMLTVRRIFEMAAEDRSLLSIKKALERDGVPTARGHRLWGLGTLQHIVENDVYRTRDVEELRPLLSAEAEHKLEPDERYGVWWYGRKRHHQEYKTELGSDGSKRYHKGRRVEDLPREQWVAIPVPDCGIPPHIVDTARSARSEYRKPATTGYFWQLSGGVIRCGGCGHAMSGVHTGNKGKRRPYYRCHHRARNGPDTCPNAKYHRADRIEEEVWREVLSVLKDPERLRTGIERFIEEQRAALQDPPTHDLRHWHAELEKFDRRRDGHLDQQAEGLISMAELKKKLAVLEERREVAEQELEKLVRHEEHLAELERDVEALMERYSFEAREGLDLYKPEDRHDAYRALGIKVISFPDGTIELTGGAVGEVRSDIIQSMPMDLSQAPLSTGASLPFLTVTPPLESL
jgi:site-specific DNA recombinase